MLRHLNHRQLVKSRRVKVGLHNGIDIDCSIPVLLPVVVLETGNRGGIVSGSCGAGASSSNSGKNRDDSRKSAFNAHKLLIRMNEQINIIYLLFRFIKAF